MPPIKDTKKEEDTSKTTAKVEESIEAEQKLSGSQFVTKDELSSFGENLFVRLSGLFKKEMTVHQDFTGTGEVITSQELGKDYRGVEPVSENDLVAQADLEKFMNEVLIIYVHPSPNKEDHQIIVPNVNGINQPIIRGQKCQVKRKYVEALARNRLTRYEQKFPDPSKPHNYIMSPDSVVKDPFTVIQDPNPKGIPWLQNLLNEA